MKRLLMALAMGIVFAGCGDQGANEEGIEDENDSVSTAPVTDPSYRPNAEADSAARQMNLDSTQAEKSQ